MPRPGLTTLMMNRKRDPARHTPGKQRSRDHPIDIQATPTLPDATFTTKKLSTGAMDKRRMYLPILSAQFRSSCPSHCGYRVNRVSTVTITITIMARRGFLGYDLLK